MNIYQNYPLKHLNTFNIDVKAKYFYEIQSENELVEFIKANNQSNDKLLILGEGSNILFTRHYDGIILKYIEKGIQIVDENEKEIFIEAKAGELWDELVNYCVFNNYYGIENLSLIPGTVGAAPIQNIGAYGVELKEVVEYVVGYFLDNGNKQILSKDECLFNYRDSIFKNKLREKFIITSVVIRLSKEKKLNITYRALKDYFLDSEYENITLKDVRDAVIKIRKDKLPDPTKLGNAGSFFKNPTINYSQLLELQKKFPDIIFYKINDKYKIYAGWLIEKCGYKGKRFGNVGTYEKQALVIVNYGNATGEEIKNFADTIKEEVLNSFGIKLEYEVNIV